MYLHVQSCLAVRDKSNERLRPVISSFFSGFLSPTATSMPSLASLSRGEFSTHSSQPGTTSLRPDSAKSSNSFRSLTEPPKPMTTSTVSVTGLTSSSRPSSTQAINEEVDSDAGAFSAIPHPPGDHTVALVPWTAQGESQTRAVHYSCPCSLKCRGSSEVEGKLLCDPENCAKCQRVVQSNVGSKLQEWEEARAAKRGKLMKGKMVANE